MDTLTAQPLNPWLSIWTKPRLTIQQVIDTDPRRLVILLAALSGIVQALSRASSRNMGDTLELWLIFLLATVLGSLGGIFSLYVGGALLRWTGRWLGGEANSQQIRAAIAWSSIPTVWLLAVWVPELWAYGSEWFTTITPRMDANPFQLLGFLLVELVLTLWALVLFAKCLGQVQQFSAWKAIGNAILAFLVVIVPLLGLVFVVIFLV